MPSMRRLLSGIALSLLAFSRLLSVVALADEPVPRQAPVDFVRDIRPIFAAHCHECHAGKRQEGGLRLNARETALAGGDSGQKAIVPSEPKASRLVRAIDGSDPEFRMPPEGEGEPLSAEQVALISRWISEGANWPEAAEFQPDRAEHWAWHKPKKSPLPNVQRADWPRQALDRFVLFRLEQDRLAPAPEASRYLLVRRVYLDLVGLPPTPAEVDAFVNDQAPGAYERMVDRVLADPAYGERWARVWLDLARYADSKGYGSDPLRNIWRYRDWVIEAFNRNLPYDQFTIEQLAGDLLPNPTPDQILATAFHRNTMANDEGGTDDEEFRVAAVKDRIETTMQVWMGLTMGCAKCHSHKFDPITQREYYQAYALFDQTEDADRGDEAPLVPTPTARDRQRLADRHAQIAAIQSQLDTPPPNVDAELAAWEQAVRQQSAGWTPMELTATASDGVTFEALPDRSLRAGGANPDRSTYHLETTTSSPSISAIRLEALPDEGLPQSGPGRAAGNFVLNELHIAAAPLVPKPVAGRFVRVEIPGPKKTLSLAEVQVFAGAENLALAGKATQSSLYGDAVAQRAIDNNTDGNFDTQSVTHSADGDDPWWEVDLGRTAQLDRIVVWNRTDSNLQSRLKDFRVIVLNESREPIWQRAVAEPPQADVSFDLAEATRVDLADATADFSQADWPIERAIDGKVAADPGWAISPQTGKAHYAVFRFSRPLVFEGGAKLKMSLVQSYGGQHTLGRFRISVTDAAVPLAAVPSRIHEILLAEPKSRTIDQRTELARYYWSQAPATDALRAHVAKLNAEINEIEKQIPVTPIMRELAADKRRVTHTMIKGNFRMPGEPVTPALPAAFHPLPRGAELNRLGLARWLVDRDNPLTARVMVNRLWAQLFGMGLVATQEDFGTQGIAPTHPELLDWLAVEFLESGWDVKALLRQIVTSATYRQSSSPAAEVLAQDPNNLLLARGPRYRLEAEMVRDQALAIAGLLSRKQGGASVYPPQPPNLWRAAFNGQRTWATSTGDDRYRRGLYTYWRRTVPYPSMAVFDAPSREICSLRRISTNTPLQAFVTLNDPVYVEAAQSLARRIVGEAGLGAAERAALALRLALSRPPQPEQVAQLVALYESELEHYRKSPEEAVQLATDPLGPLPVGYEASELAAWTVVANVILNLDGVLTKR
jgi:mono/diheme cytochrome c family protein